jgi:TPR repeat protein
LRGPFGASGPAGADALHKAAEQGFAKAQNNLAQLYLEGDGVPSDRAKAIALLRDSAAHGDNPAGKSLQNIEGSSDWSPEPA